MRCPECGNSMMKMGEFGRCTKCGMIKYKHPPIRGVPYV